MTRRQTITIAFAVLLAVSPMLAQTSRTAEVRFKAAQQAEDVDGDLKGAIEQYKQLAKGGDRVIAAKALIQMAGCYLKLGDAESQKIYEQVVRDFADQKEAVALAQARLGAPSPRTGVVSRQVWTGPNVDSYGTVSPDGRLISYTDWSTSDLAIHDVATGRNRHLTTHTWDGDQAEYNSGSAISPDGKRVAYGWSMGVVRQDAEQFSEVRLIDVNGGKPRTLFTTRSAAHRDIGPIWVSTWSPDGAWVAVHLNRGDHRDIALVSTADGALRILKTVTDAGWKLPFSPDGKYLAYETRANDDSEQREMHVISLATGQDTPVFAHPANDSVLGWARDDRHLLFVSDRNGLSGIWMVPIRDGKADGEPQLIKPNVSPLSMGVTQSGALYYAVGTSGKDVYVASADFESGKVLSAPTSIQKPYVGSYEYPQWSPDGKYLAYLTLKNPNTVSARMTGLAIRSMESGNVRELKPDLASLWGQGSNRPLWSADGNSLIVNGDDRKGGQGIYRIDIQNGHTTPLVTREPAQGELAARALSPDGQTLYMMRTDLQSREHVLLARDMTSGKERELVRRSSLQDVAVSPDGKFVATVGRDLRSKSASLLLIPTQSGEPRDLLRVSDPERMGDFVGWTPDSKSVLFRKFTSGTQEPEPWRISIDDRVARMIDLNHAFGGHPSVHPDGHQFAFVKGEGANTTALEIWALENFLPQSTTRK